MASFGKTMRWTGVGLIAVLFLVFFFAIYANYSSGVRAGVPVKFTRKGVIFKTYEGELNVGGLTNTADGAIPTTWNFTVRRSAEDVHEALEEAMSNQKRVKLLYNEKYVQLPWRGDTKYFVYEVQILEDHQ
jgi:hypothetical protein